MQMKESVYSSVFDMPSSGVGWGLFLGGWMDGI